jgi:hypothetical protein
LQGSGKKVESVVAPELIVESPFDKDVAAALDALDLPDVFVSMPLDDESEDCKQTAKVTAAETAVDAVEAGSTKDYYALFHELHNVINGTNEQFHTLGVLSGLESLDAIKEEESDMMDGGFSVAPREPECAARIVDILGELQPVDLWKARRQEQKDGKKRQQVLRRTAVWRKKVKATRPQVKKGSFKRTHRRRYKLPPAARVPAAQAPAPAAAAAHAPVASASSAPAAQVPAAAASVPATLETITAAAQAFSNYGLENVGLPDECMPFKMGRGKHSFTIDSMEGDKIDVLVRDKKFFLKSMGGNKEMPSRHSFSWSQFGGVADAWAAISSSIGFQRKLEDPSS